MGSCELRRPALWRAPAGVLLAVLALHAVVLERISQAAPPAGLAVRPAAGPGAPARWPPAPPVVEALVLPPVVVHRVALAGLQAVDDDRAAEGAPQAAGADHAGNVGTRAERALTLVSGGSNETAGRVSSHPPLPRWPDRSAARVPPAERGPRAEQAPVSAAAPLESAAPAAPAASSAVAWAAAVALPPPGAAASAPLPVYATRVAPPAVLAFEMRRGLLSGQAQIRWTPRDERYELRFDAQVMGASVIGQLSRGGFDAGGLAPERFVEQRRGRPARAVNFQRSEGRISFSASEQVQPLWPGVQDTLSWMVQLAAIVEADPQRFGPGTDITIAVAGLRGETDAWTFEVEAWDAVPTAEGASVRALRLRREPRRPYDTRAQIWLDPARHHLPVRLRLASDDASALELLALPAAPGAGPGRPGPPVTP